MMKTTADGEWLLCPACECGITEVDQNAGYCTNCFGPLMTKETRTMSGLSTGEVKQFQRAISTAAWKLDLWKFAEAIGHEADHDWTKDKFKQFSELSRAISRFDAETLTKILNAAS